MYKAIVIILLLFILLSTCIGCTSFDILKKKTIIKPKPYKERVTEWYSEFKNNKEKIDNFQDTFPDLNILQKLTETYTWLLKNVRKNYDKTFFNWCSSHSGRKENTNGRVQFRYDSTGKFYVGYCSGCYRSESYEPKTIQQIDSKCCGTKIVPERDM